MDQLGHWTQDWKFLAQQEAKKYQLLTLELLQSLQLHKYPLPFITPRTLFCNGYNHTSVYGKFISGTASMAIQIYHGKL